MLQSKKALAGLGAAAVCAGVLLGQSAAPAQTAPGSIYELIDAPGVDLVRRECAGCHGLTQITQSGGHPRYEWDRLMRTMVVLDDPTFNAILGYLSTNYPNPNAAPAAPEPLNVNFREWSGSGATMSAPTQAPDGAVWWVDRRAGAIGRRDVATRQMQSWPLPEGARPSSVVVDSAGGVWYVGAASIGKFDPVTGQAQTHPLTERAARNPSAAAFDTGGNLWFTVEATNTIGRFDPRTGEVRLTTASSRARPQGLSVGQNGALWVGCAGDPCLIRVNTDTLELTEVRLPSARSNAVRVGVGGDGAVWYTNENGGAIGRYDPATAAFKEWPSPGGARSAPSGLVISGWNVWYTEMGSRTGALVRFDPRSEQFQTWPLPADAGAVRDLSVTASGNVLLHPESGAERVFLGEATRAQ